MTKLTKKVRRETDIRGNDRPLIIELLRTRYEVDIGTVFWLGVKAAALELWKERAAKRKARRRK